MDTQSYSEPRYHRSSEPEGLGLLVRDIPSAVLQLAVDGTLLYANPGSGLLLRHWNIELGGPVPAEIALRVRQTVEQQIGHEIEIEVGHQVLSLLTVPVGEEGYVNLFGKDTTRQKVEQAKLLLDAQVFEGAK
jgi:hypothetical protein